MSGQRKGEKMKSLIFAATLLAMIVLLVSPAHAYMETFETGNPGWYTYYIDNMGYPWGEQSTFNATGGNPGGNISANVYNNMNKRLYSFDINGALFGDLTGETLKVDYKITGTVTGPGSDGKVRFYIGSDSSNYFVSTDAYSWDPNAGAGWMTYEISVTSSAFSPWPGQTGTKSFEEVAAHPAWIGLVFTDGGFNTLGLVSTGGAVIEIDNFGTPPPPSAVPVPGAIWLLGSGLVGLVGLKGRIRRP